MATCSEHTGFTEYELLEHLPALRNFARRFHSSPSDVDDLVQETSLKAIANADKFQRGTQLRSWLFTIMRNTFCTKFGLTKREDVGLADDTAHRSLCLRHRNGTFAGTSWNRQYPNCRTIIEPR